MPEPAAIPCPPEPPTTDYLVVGYEVRESSLALRVIFPGTPMGFASAGSLLDRLAGRGRREGVMSAVAWFVERPLDLCPDGRERLVSVFHWRARSWLPWRPEERTGPPPRLGSIARDHRGFATRPKGGFKDLGDGSA